MNDPTLPLSGLSSVRGKSVVARFDGGMLSSNGGVLALAEVEKRLRVAERLARCIDDPRCPDQVIHSLSDMIGFRMKMIAAGYEVIASVHAALEKLGRVRAMPEPVALTPPVPIKKSVTPEYLISLEDGRRYKALKRHLRGRGLTPAQYRQKWNLPGDYPMVAPDYAAKRSQLAKSLGLGSKAYGAAAKPRKVPGKRGRPRNAA